ncbi:tail fiber domain-containing protein [candidate division KSB1 bacterium]
MKTKLFLSILLSMVFTLNVHGQSPQKINYQAVIRNSSGVILANQAIGLRINILHGTATGIVVYQETHTAGTNQFGLVNLQIGSGTAVLGSFAGINWRNGDKYIELELDPTGGTSYSSMGTSQLISVPYALFAENVGNADDADADSTNELQNLSLSGSNLSISDGNTVSLPTGTTYTAGSGISISGNTINNTAPDQTVTLTGSGGTSITGTYPNFNISSTGLPAGYYGATLYHDSTSWKVDTSTLFNPGFCIGINSKSTLPPIDLNVKNKSIFHIAAIKAESWWGSRGYAGVTGINNYDGTNTLDIYVNHIGLLGVSVVSSSFPTYGVYGHSDDIGVYGEYLDLGRYGYLGSSDYGVYGQYSSDKYGYIGSNSYGVYGQYSTDKYGYFGGYYYGAYGQYLSNRYGYLGGSAFGVYGQYDSNKYGYLGGNSYGVYGKYSTSNYGFIGSSSYGVYGTTTTTGTGYGGYFKNYSSSGYGTGVYARGDYTGSTNTGITRALYALSYSTTQTQRGIDCYVNKTGSNGQTYGIYNEVDVGSANNQLSRGMYIICNRSADNYANYGLYCSANNGTTVYGIYASGSGASGSNYAGYFVGNLAYTGTLSNPSDLKFKKNMVSITGSLEKIKLLNTYSYEYKSTGEAEKMNFSKGRQFGFIAQELEILFPELVSDNVHTYDEKVKQGETEVINEQLIKYKGINYIGMIPVLTEAIKEQQTIIEDQQQQIDELKLLVQQLIDE